MARPPPSCASTKAIGIPKPVAFAASISVASTKSPTTMPSSSFVTIWPSCIGPQRLRPYSLRRASRSPSCVTCTSSGFAPSGRRHSSSSERVFSPAGAITRWVRGKVSSSSGMVNSVGRLAAEAITRAHVEQYLHHRCTPPSESTGKMLGDKARRAHIIALKATWNWGADTDEDGEPVCSPPVIVPSPSSRGGLFKPRT